MRRMTLLIPLLILTMALAHEGRAAEPAPPAHGGDGHAPASASVSLPSGAPKASRPEAPRAAEPTLSQSMRAARTHGWPLYEPSEVSDANDAEQSLRLSEKWAKRAGVRERSDSGGPETKALALIGSNFPIANFPDAVNAAEDPAHPDIAFNPSRNEYLAVWDAAMRDTSQNIYARRLSSAGSPIGGTFVVCQAGGPQVVPSVAYDSGTGEYWVVWTDFRAGVSGRVYGQRVSGTGSLVGPEIQMNTGIEDAFAARVACGSRRAVVTWTSQAEGALAVILVRGYEGSGSPMTPPLLLSDTSVTATEPDICYNGDDRHFLVVWHESHTSTGWDIMGFPLTNDLYVAGARMGISTASANQKRARAAYSPIADRYCIVWQDGRSLQSWDIYGQLLSRVGNLVGSALPVFTGSLYDGVPVVASQAGVSQFMVAFDRDFTGAGQDQIYGCSVSGGGAVSSAFVIRQYHEFRTSPAIEAGSAGYLVAWSDYWPVEQPDIQAQRIRTNTALQGPLIVVIGGRKGQQGPSVAYGSARNEYLVVWQDSRTGSDYHVYGRRLSADGGWVGQELIIATDGELKNYPDIAYNQTSDEYLVVWTGIYSSGMGRDVRAQRLSGTGQRLGAAVWVSRDTGAGNEGYPSVTYNQSANEYLVAWHAWINGWRIWGQRVSGSGQLLGGNFQIIASNGVGEWPRLAHNPQSNQYVVVWFDQRTPGQWAVYGQRLGGTGALLGGNFAVSANLPGIGTALRLRCDVAHDEHSGEYLVVWGDKRSGPDIYGQRLNASAGLIGGGFAINTADIAGHPSVRYDRFSREYVVVWEEYHEASTQDIHATRVSAAGAPTGGEFAVAAVAEVQRHSPASSEHGQRRVSDRMARLSPSQLRHLRAAVHPNWVGGPDCNQYTDPHADTDTDSRTGHWTVPRDAAHRDEELTTGERAGVLLRTQNALSAGARSPSARGEMDRETRRRVGVSSCCRVPCLGRRGPMGRDGQTVVQVSAHPIGSADKRWCGALTPPFYALRCTRYGGYSAQRKPIVLNP